MEGGGERALAVERYRKAILQLNRMPLATLDEALAHITETCARALGVERVSIWFFDAPRMLMVCRDLYLASRDRHEHGESFAAASVPRYYQALSEGRCFATDQALSDPRTAEFAPTYLAKHGVTAMLDAPIRVAGTIIGIVCCEQVGPPKPWTEDEQVFVGNVADFVALTVTADHQRSAEASLHEAYARLEEQQILLREYRRMLDEAEQLAHSGSWSWDVKTDSFTWSDGMYRNHGLEPGAFPPTYQGLLDRVYPRDRALLDQAVRRALADGTPFDCRHRIVLPDASVHVVRARGQVQRDANGEVAVLFGTCQDITNEELAQRLKSEFIALASHELRTPIAILQGTVQVLLRATEKGLSCEQRQALLRRLLAECRLLSGIADDLIEAAAVESGLVPLNLQVLSLDKWLPEVVEAWRDTAAQQGVELQLNRPAAPLPAVSADPRRLHSILGVLIENALKFSSPGRHVRLGVSPVPGYVRFSVSDEGEGIDPDSLSRIFEPFFYRPDPKAYSTRSLGLDLFITQEIVRRHGGEIRAESTPSSGTTFSFTLPTAAGDPTTVP